MIGLRVATIDPFESRGQQGYAPLGPVADPHGFGCSYCQPRRSRVAGHKVVFWEASLTCKYTRLVLPFLYFSNRFLMNF
jgi:hypothetical protein